jgi:hypothetical protein
LIRVKAAWGSMRESAAKVVELAMHAKPVTVALIKLPWQACRGAWIALFLLLLAQAIGPCVHGGSGHFGSAPSSFAASPGDRRTTALEEHRHRPEPCVPASGEVSACCHAVCGAMVARDHTDDAVERWSIPVPADGERLTALAQPRLDRPPKA